MNQYNEISTLQYMGSKTRIISHICEPIIKNKSIKTVVDLFAGTGSVGYALKAHKNIISNDLEYYAYIINHAILNGCDFSVTDEISFWNAVEQQSASLQAKVCTAVTTENKFFIDTVDYKQYQLFCEKTPSVFMPQSDDPRLKEILDLVDQVTPGKAPTVETPCLFLTYYANAYFGIAQCCQIDAIRSNIGQIEDKRTRYVLLTMLMSVMSASASTTTHFAQYLKVKSKATCNNLIGKRKINIIESCKSLLAEYRQAGLCTADRKAPSVCYNLDFSDCLDSISLNNETLVYADPPYFKEHYSRYYHVLNTVCLYDYPAMAMNPQTHELSIGRYREDRSVSDFGKKAKALGAFDTLITKCSNAGAWLMISYSDNSIVDISDIQALAEKKYDVLIEKVELSHSKQGRSSISKVDEYIFICRPKKIVHDVDEKLSVIKELKPIVDNPAGFMHNYMARKPYNVVSEIIKRFCPDGGCVYDPMFGSGTTIIEASKLGRKAIGTDINLLAYKLCKASLTRWNLSKVEEVIDTFCAEVSFACESLYCFEDFNEDRILERCHFDQCGSELVPTIYCGDVINFKSYSKSYKMKRRIENPEENRAIFLNVHEPIIDRVTWEKVQALQKGTRRKKPTVTQEPSVFSGRLKCPECGGNLNFHFNQKNHDIKFFSCQNHNSGLRKCSATHYIRLDFLEQVVLYEVNRLATFANEYERDFVKAMMGRSAKVAENDRARKQRELNTLLTRDKELDMLFERLYEDNVAGKIDDTRFARMSKRYEQEQGEIGAKVKTLRLELKKAEGQQMDMEDFLETVRRYTHVTKITRRMVSELIDHIDVYHAEKQDGVTNQQVVIHYNCIGAFEVPDRKKIPEADIIMETRKGVAVSYAPAQIAV